MRFTVDEVANLLAADGHRHHRADVGARSPGRQAADGSLCRPSGIDGYGSGL
ncbi:hypothetical protein [Actinoplanes sichuanensis]|uniref:Uncharacterized protein n=1 Tax=Actinoplanes sichuanensis TaxID=512349 RepID=A0ABW4A1C6_9ACTN